MRIFEVTQVVVYRLSASPLTLSIHASGLAATPGWTNPRLDNSGDSNPKDMVLEFAFEADRPGGIVPEVITPIAATVQFVAKAGADAVIVASRTNTITVHASEFIDFEAGRANPALANLARYTTMAVGEEGWPPPGPHFTTRPMFEERPPWTFRLGEDGPRPPMTDPRSDDPIPPYFNPHLDPDVDPWGPLVTPFGRYGRR